MELEKKYDSESEVPEGFKHLYTEKDGSFILIGADEIKTVQDVQNVKTAMDKRLAEKVDEANAKHQKAIDKIAEEAIEQAARDELLKAKKPEDVAKATKELESLEVKKRDAQIEQLKAEFEEKNKAFDELSNTTRQSKIISTLKDSLLKGGISTDALDVGLAAFNNGFDLSESGDVIHKESGKTALDMAAEFLNNAAYLKPGNTANNITQTQTGQSTGIKGPNQDIRDSIAKAPVTDM